MTKVGVSSFNTCITQIGVCVLHMQHGMFVIFRFYFYSLGILIKFQPPDVLEMFMQILKLN